MAARMGVSPRSVRLRIADTPIDCHSSQRQQDSNNLVGKPKGYGRQRLAAWIAAAAQGVAFLSSW